jgi:hypothetical protein
MPAPARRRLVLVASGSLLGLAALIGSLVLARELRMSRPDTLPDFANQKAIYEPAIGVHYTFSGVDAVLLRPDDLGAGWYFGNNPAAEQPGGPTRALRRLVKATRAPGSPWKAQTCVMETVTRWTTTTAAAADLESLAKLINWNSPRQRVVDGVVVTVLDMPQLRSAVFRRGLDVFNLNVCLHLATSDFSPAAADAVVEAAVRRSARRT